MTDLAEAQTAPGPAMRPAPEAIPALAFALTVFVSAALVFVVEPMVARLILPLLGGSPAVWNTSLAFFQAALLVGYVYAHALQRLASMRRQVVIHIAVLLAAALALPLHVTSLLGEPPPGSPMLWTVEALAFSIGAPFAALSATAPLVQAWHARVIRHEGAPEPYVLYAASNFGSLIALVAYPVVIEPTLALRAQTGFWSAGYGLFVLMAAGLGAALWLQGGQAAARGDPAPGSRAATWRQRLTWTVLAAIPSSLMLGATSHITTDVGSAPFIWVAPLALYLLTFIIAFHSRPLLPARIVLLLQAGAVTLCAIFIHTAAGSFLEGLAIHLGAFFLTALICHQALVARRPEPDRLTDFYIWMSVGGVVGGSLNAFVAPIVFNSVVEYPAVLVLSCLVRPWGEGRFTPLQWTLVFLGVVAATAATEVLYPDPPLHSAAYALVARVSPTAVARLLLGVAATAAILLRGRAWLFMAVIFAIVLSAEKVTDEGQTLASWRSFFGVMKMSHADVSELGGEVRMLVHGGTMHGAEAVSPAFRCQPLVYYAHPTPIGQVFDAEQRLKPALNIGAVGLGAGTVATYTRPGDTLRFFEIDPLVGEVANRSGLFSFTTTCAKGLVDFTYGDARLTVAKQPPGGYDLLLIDAFSSDSVPAHLLTVEAVKMYLSKLKSDGVLVLHLSNRNLDLIRPAQAVAIAAGAPALAQRYGRPFGAPMLLAADEDAVLIGKSQAALAPFANDPRWSPANAGGVAPWTDDYTNLFGALVRRLQERWGGPTEAAPPRRSPALRGPLPGP